MKIFPLISKFQEQLIYLLGFRLSLPWRFSSGISVHMHHVVVTPQFMAFYSINSSFPGLIDGFRLRRYVANCGLIAEQTQNNIMFVETILIHVGE